LLTMSLSLCAPFLVLATFIFLYPIAMSTVWAVGGLFFWWRRERVRRPDPENDPGPLLPTTVLVPCHDEEASIAETCRALSELDYPHYEVILIDDASTDGTVGEIEPWLASCPHFRLIRLEENQGKARALNAALSVVSSPLTVVIDADTLLAPDALRHLAAPFGRQPRLGAVTGNPIVFRRRNLLEKLQAAEFASIIGLIKRAQRSVGRVLTVSGCVAAYRTDVLREMGGFSSRTATEDIDVTWQIQRRAWEVWFEPRARAYIQAPSNLREFWRQRSRWALGGWHLLRTHSGVFRRWKWRRMWPVYLDFVLSYFWSFCFVLGTLLWLVNRLFLPVPFGLSPIPAWHGAMISLFCMVQFATALVVNHQYDRALWRTFFWVPWYPLAYFAFGALAVTATCWRGVFGPLESAGRWTSPRRNREQEQADLHSGTSAGVDREQGDEPPFG